MKTRFVVALLTPMLGTELVMVPPPTFEVSGQSGGACGPPVAAPRTLPGSQESNLDRLLAKSAGRSKAIEVAASRGTPLESVSSWTSTPVCVVGGAAVVPAGGGVAPPENVSAAD